MSRILPLFVLGVAVASCRATPEPLPEEPLGTPALTIEEIVAPGDLLSGPTETVGSEGTPVDLTCRLLYLEREWVGELTPLEEESSLVADIRGATPVLPVGQLTAGGRIGVGTRAQTWLDGVRAGSAGRTRELLATSLVLLPASTYIAAATASEGVEDPKDWLDEFPDRGPIDRRVALAVSASPHGPKIALLIDDLDPLVEAALLAESLESADAMPGPPRPAAEEIVRREAIVVDVALEVGETLVATLPSPFASGEGSWFALVLERGPEDPDPDRIGVAEAALTRASEYHSASVAPVSVDSYVDLRRQQASSAFRERGGAQALLLLATEEHAPLAENFALSAGPEVLAELSLAAFPEESQASEGASVDIGWQLESAAWRLLCQHVMDEDPDPMFEATLGRHAGALSRFPDVVLDALEATSDADSFQARLVEEQRFFLEDPDPSLRLRAHDWLLERDEGLAGYDPLGPENERSAALEAARIAAEAANEEAAAEGDAR